MKKNKIKYIILSIILIISVFFGFKSYYHPKVIKNISIALPAEKLYKLISKNNSIDKIKYEKLKNQNLISVIFEKKTLNYFAKKGIITIKNGYEILDLFRTQSIINPYIWQICKDEPIEAEHTYIFINNQELFVQIYPIIRKKLIKKDILVKVYENKNFRYDGDITHNYIIEVSALKTKIINLPLYYSDKLINIFKYSNLKIIFKDPDENEIFTKYNYKSDIYLTSKNNIKDLMKINFKKHNFILDRKLYFDYKNHNKIKIYYMKNLKNLNYKKFNNYFYQLIYYNFEDIKSFDKLLENIKIIKNKLKSYNVIKQVKPIKLTMKLKIKMILFNLFNNTF